MPTSSPPHNATETTSTPVQRDPTDGLGKPVEVPRHGWRHRVRSKPGLRETYRVGVFTAGLLCIAAGFALMVLPGPLTIPPVLLGLWIWSTEFRFAERFFDAFKDKARDAWAHAKLHPTPSACITGGGLLTAGAGLWAVSHFRVVDMAKEAFL
jgi:hypothetical protein